MMGIRRGSTVMGIVIALCGQLFAAESTNAIKPNLKVLLCTGDYGMFGQDRAKLISESVTKAATGAVVEIEQSFNFVKKLEAPGYAERFDAIVAGDIALGQMTTRAQQALVRFVAGGGGFIYVVAAKSTIGFAGVAEIEPNPLKEILPYAWPEANPVKGARPDARKLLCTDAFFAGFDFAKTPWLAPDKDGKVPERGPLALERDEGKGRVLSLYSAFGADYAGPSHSKKIVPGGWQDWGQFGDFWFRLLDRVSAGSPVRAMTRAESDGKAFHEVPCTATVAVDAGKPVDEVRASDFSIVALQQLYNEDGGGNEALFFELNPRDWFDRRSGEVFENKAGKAFPDGKGPLFEQFNIKGILMGHNSYGSYYVWTEKDYLNGVSNGWVKTSDTNKPWLATYDAYVKKMNEDYQVEVAQHTAIAKKYPKFCTYFQPGNEPPCDDNYFAFHNKISGDILKQVPDMKIIGPNKAFNISAVDVPSDLVTAFALVSKGFSTRQRKSTVMSQVCHTVNSCQATPPREKVGQRVGRPTGDPPLEDPETESAWKTEKRAGVVVRCLGTIIRRNLVPFSRMCRLITGWTIRRTSNCSGATPGRGRRRRLARWWRGMSTWSTPWRCAASAILIRRRRSRRRCSSSWPARRAT